MNNEEQIPPQDNGAAQNSVSASDQSTVSDQPDLTTLQSELENARNRLNELTQISQQALADLQNYKKRTEDEKIKFVAFANAALISELLPVLDDLDRAMEQLPQEPSGREWANGIAIIVKKLKDTLAAHGVEEILTTEQQFDPNLHEAMLMEEGPADQIIRELARGYRIGDRILRRSRVVVGQTATAPTDGQTAPPSQTPLPDSQESPLAHNPDDPATMPENTTKQ